MGKGGKHGEIRQEKKTIEKNLFPKKHGRGVGTMKEQVEAGTRKNTKKPICHQNRKKQGHNQYGESREKCGTPRGKKYNKR